MRPTPWRPAGADFTWRAESPPPSTCVLEGLAAPYRAARPGLRVDVGSVSDAPSLGPGARLVADGLDEVVAVPPVLTAEDFANSKLYDPGFSRRFRRAARKDSAS